MARPIRVQFEDAVYHVMSRGNARQDIVLGDADRETRLDWLQRIVETYGWRLHAFAVMMNHDLCEASQVDLGSVSHRGTEPRRCMETK
jgi:REP element-mobilizing transposase RayT